MPKQYEIPEGELRQLYVSEGLSIRACAAHFGCSASPIKDRLEKFGIEIRSRGNQPLEIPRDVLRDLYVDTGLTTIEIAERFDCHPSTISSKLNEFGIPTDGPNHGHSVNIPEDELAELYVEEKCTTYELAERFSCDPTVVERRLRWFGIETRHTTAGDGDWQYKYGCNWRTRRREALEAANYRCELCGITDGEHRAKYVDRTRGVGLGLDVHHKVSTRLFNRWEAASLEDANATSNLQVLCQECHTKYGDRVGTSEVQE